MAKSLLFILLAMVGSVCATDLISSNAPPLAPGVRKIQAHGIENPFQITTNIFSGGSPEGDLGFETLQKLGIRTIITVDGAQPDLERAHAHGMRYIHLPHGYDGIPRDTQPKLVKAGEQIQGPVYIHCHHGKHRGPAAAAILCLAEGTWTKQQADAWLAAAGTDPNFPGLFETIRNFEKPTGADLAKIPSNFPESQKPIGVVESMVTIDEIFDHLTAIRKAGYATPPSNPDLVTQREIVQLREHLREAQRLPDAIRRGPDFISGLRDAEANAQAFGEMLIGATDRTKLDAGFARVSESCVQCHKRFRNTMAATSEK